MEELNSCLAQFAIHSSFLLLKIISKIDVENLTATLPLHIYRSVFLCIGDGVFLPPMSE